MILDQWVAFVAGNEERLGTVGNKADRLSAGEVGVLSTASSLGETGGNGTDDGVTCSPTADISFEDAGV